MLPNISRSKGNQTIKFGQFIEYIQKCDGEIDLILSFFKI